MLKNLKMRSIMKQFREFDISKFIYQRFRSNYLVNSEYKLNNLYTLLSCLFYPVRTIFTSFNSKRIEYYKIAGCGYGNYAVSKVIEDIFGEKYPNIRILYSDEEGGKFFYSEKQSSGAKSIFIPSEYLTSADAFYMPIHTTSKIVNIIIPTSLYNDQNDYSYFLKVIRALLLYGIEYKITVQ